jgi:hypothetical protein
VELDARALDRERLALSFLDGERGAFLVGLDPAGVARFWTPAAERFFAIAAADAEGKPGLDRLGLTPASLAEAARNGAWQGSATLTRADGTKADATVSLSPASGGFAVIAVPGPDPRASCCSVIAASAHDLRSPLNVVLGFAELLQSDGSGSLLPGQREFVSEILRGGAQMLRLVANVTDFARAANGQLKLAQETFAPGPAIERASGPARQRAQDRRIDLELQLGSSPCELRCDPSRFQQLVECALFDAIDLSLEGGKVVLALTAEGQRLRLAIDSAPRGEPGVRLGLALARRLLEVLGGEPVAGSALFEGLLPLAAA